VAEAKPARRRTTAKTETAAAEAEVAEAKPKRRRTTAKTETATAEAEVAEAKPARRRTTAKTETATAEAEVAEAKPARRRRSASGADEEQPAEVAPAVQVRPQPRMREKLRSEVGPALMQEFGYTSPMQIPRLTKVVVNIGLGEALTNARALENASGDIALITGQRPVTNRARKSVAGFKIREGMAIGVSVTLRGRRMYEFLDRLISSALPRIRDFQGLSRDSFDGRGNYSLGIQEQIIFPEIDYNSIDRIRGLQIVIVTTAPTDIEGLRLLELLGMPFTRSREATAVA
jgi:large subunit ribosomal protein L5